MDKFYQLECKAGQKESEMTLRKIEWYRETIMRLESEIKLEREDILLTSETNKRKLRELENKINDMVLEKQRFD